MKDDSQGTGTGARGQDKARFLKLDMRTEVVNRVRGVPQSGKSKPEETTGLSPRGHFIDERKEKAQKRRTTESRKTSHS